MAAMSSIETLVGVAVGDKMGAANLKLLVEDGVLVVDSAPIGDEEVVRYFTIAFSEKDLAARFFQACAEALRSG
jgi:hypothetical protein